MDEVDLLTRRLQREKSARQQAELILEQKSRELYEANEAIRKSNLELGEANSRLQQDIVERKRAEQALITKELEARLLHRATTMAAETHSFEAAMRECLALVCDATGWTLGHAYLRNEDESNELIPTGIWYECGGHSHELFRATTERTPLEAGVGLPGRVLTTGEPVWIVDVQHEDNFPRKAACVGTGLKGAFAFPIKVAGRCAAVLEFFREEEAAEDQNFRQIIRSVGEQLGRVLERKRAEQALRASEQRIRMIIDSALDAVVSIDAAGVINDWNAQARTTFGQTREEALGRHISKTIFLSGSGGTAGGDLMELIVATAADAIHRRVEVRALGRDGRELPIELAVAPVQVGGSLGYSIFIRDVTDRHRAAAEREHLNSQLITLSRSAGMAEVATGVLHNVGNVLNSVNVSATLAVDRLRDSKVTNLARAAAMIQEHSSDLPAFLTTDDRGRQLPGYLVKLSEHLGREQSEVLQELTSLEKNIEHIKQVVSMQQAHARVAGVIETVGPQNLLDDALLLNVSALDRHQIQVRREYASVPTIQTDRHKVLQILVNLVSNAKYAMEETPPQNRRLTLRIGLGDQQRQRLQIQVIDNGMGIKPENLTRIFAHGFTTRKDGHGFGLHSAALAAKDLGGSLEVQSDGPGTGATFTLELPLSGVGAAS